MDSTYLRSLIVHSGNYQGHSIALAIARGEISSGRVCFYGVEGVGKTQLLLSTASDLRYEQPHLDIKITDGGLLLEETKTLGRDKSCSKSIDDGRNADVLFINDIHKLGFVAAGSHASNYLQEILHSKVLLVATSCQGLNLKSSDRYELLPFMKMTHEVRITPMDFNGKVEFIRCFELHYKYWFTSEQKAYLLENGGSDFRSLKGLCLFMKNQHALSQG